MTTCSIVVSKTSIAVPWHSYVMKKAGRIGKPRLPLQLLMLWATLTHEEVAAQSGTQAFELAVEDLLERTGPRLRPRTEKLFHLGSSSQTKCARSAVIRCGMRKTCLTVGTAVVGRSILSV